MKDITGAPNPHLVIKLPWGYVNTLAEFDQRLPEILDTLADEDMLVITADHRNDPTTPSTHHSREYVPHVLAGCAVTWWRGSWEPLSFVCSGACLASIAGRGSSGLHGSFLFFSRLICKIRVLLYILACETVSANKLLTQPDFKGLTS